MQVYKHFQKLGIHQHGEQRYKNMNDYGKGNILGAATTLPATSALGLLLHNNNHPVLLGGYFIISAICLIILLGQTSRYLINLIRDIRESK